MSGVPIPLSRCADDVIARLARATGAAALAALDGLTLLGERAMLAGFTIPDRTSAGGGCRLFDAIDDTIALNLARPADRELLPALFQAEALDAGDEQAIGAQIAQCDAAALVVRGRSMGLAIAAEHEQRPATIEPVTPLVAGNVAQTKSRQAPRVVDLSALWAGPLASHLLWLAGAEVIKIESRARPDAMRDGQREFFALLNQGKASVVCDFAQPDDKRALIALLHTADIVIEAARPRALAQLGIDAAAIVRKTPGLVWVTITAHGAERDAAHWVGFGDDCAVAGGLSAALRAACGRTGFVGDAIADPLAGAYAALTAWEAWGSRRSGRFAVTMSHVVAHCLAEARRNDAKRLERDLLEWSAAVGCPFPEVKRRAIGPLRRLGEDTRSYLSQVTTC
jgi:hypothetical protein